MIQIDFRPSLPPVVRRYQDAACHYLYARHTYYRNLPVAHSSLPWPTPREFERLSVNGATGQENPGPQTVEEVVRRGYFAIEAVPPETAPLADRRTTAWLALEDLVRQVQTRVAIYHQNSLDIEQAKCRATNDMLGIEAQYGGPASPEQQYQTGKRVQELYSEQRAERTSLWRDVSRIRESVPVSLREYLGARRKLEILSDDDAGGLL